jgi:hypothetical protein
MMHTLTVFINYRKSQISAACRTAAVRWRGGGCASIQRPSPLRNNPASFSLPASWRTNPETRLPGLLHLCRTNLQCTNKSMAAVETNTLPESPSKLSPRSPNPWHECWKSSDDRPSEVRRRSVLETNSEHERARFCAANQIPLFEVLVCSMDPRDDLDLGA